METKTVKWLFIGGTKQHAFVEADFPGYIGNHSLCGYVYARNEAGEVEHFDNLESEERRDDLRICQRCKRLGELHKLF